MPSLSRRVGLAGVLCGSALGCSSSTTDTTALPHPTIVQVSPDEFASPPACGKAPGSLMRYVATLVDVTQELGAGGSGDDASSTDFALPSSAFEVENAGTPHYEPVPCLQGVNFGWVVSGHRYRADLLGFDRDDLELLAAGLPVVIDASSRAVVKPRWTTRCAVGKSAVQAETELTRIARYCEPWVETKP